MKVVINKCFGGFGLSTAAYEKLIEWGIPVRKYMEQERGEDGRYKPQPLNEGRVIFDRELTPMGENRLNDIYHEYKGKSRMSDRYWDTWTRDSRDDALIVRVVEELGSKAASGVCAELAVVEIPDGVDYEIDEYDGREHIAEKHRTWA
ncbi:MAG TPA: hypothetical protein VHN11_04930 [Xanthobacteraceae bacterium]|jgi:hypothetical protein|nr:hypothetical protein [Xanthobacteraceae bacterium]